MSFIRLFTLLTLLTLASLMVIGCRAAQADAELQYAEARDIYLVQCAHCHQPEGQGYAHTYPHLAGNPIVTLHDPNPMIDIVLNGRGSMPPFRNEMELEDIAKVITYVRSAWGNNASPVQPTQVK
jgi:mono/diheme cytochrome c family protein